MTPTRTWPALSPTDQRRLTTFKSIYVLTQCEGFTKAQALRLCFYKTLADAGLYADDQRAGGEQDG